MGDYGSNAALGFIEGSIIGEGANQVARAWRQGRARRLQQEEDDAEYINLYNRLVAERNHGIDLQVKIYELDSMIARQDAELAKRDHEIAKRNHEIALLTEKLHETERNLAGIERSWNAIDKMRSNLSPDHVPPDQRSE
ncbi:MAG: hypothetical protein B7Z58_13050 [Acidiphilium sp. 37-64-53]|uniref:hypothetical protein n=1 Tax=Acidiphilium sp. 37-64-53 TaxID=1970299 RepID=UPI000BD58552|nr:hypothetical protein [Acidiphilium sp. 37-64-53]OYW01004.1 MAG: hypothetical protein B7Z58_13050 [Acidiphilium sp. 37-64-53]